MAMEIGLQEVLASTMLLLRAPKQALPNSDVDYGQLLTTNHQILSRNFKDSWDLSKIYMKELNRRIFRGFEYGRHQKLTSHKNTDCFSIIQNYCSIILDPDANWEIFPE